VTTFSLLAIGLLVLLAGISAWSYLTLRSRLQVFASSLRAGEAKALQASPLVELSSVVQSLIYDYETKLSALTSERARLATVLEQITDGVLIVDAEGRIQFANPAARKLFEVDEPVGRSLIEVVRHHQLVEAWHRCQQSGELQTESIEVPASHRFLQGFAIPDLHAGGSLLLVQDLTRVRHLETVRRDFVSNISHELRTPLASLRALTETLQNGALSDKEAGPRFLERMVTEVDALTQMTQELLDLSRIESGQVELNLAAISPNELLASAGERDRKSTRLNSSHRL